MSKIDPTAKVSDGARLGVDVEVGPFCTIGANVSIGDGCRLLSHVNITGHTTIGPRTFIYPFASLSYARNYGLPRAMSDWKYHRVIQQVAPQLDEATWMTP